MSKLILVGAGVMSIIVFAAVISTWAVIYSNPIQAETTTTSVPTTTSCGLEDGATCTDPTGAECCSQECTMGPNGGLTCGGCLATAETCTTAADCCSNDCDTTTAQCNAGSTTTSTTTTTTTTTSCGLEDGDTCTMPSECCSQACSSGPNGGYTCGGCLANAETCGTSADCCSNDCDTTSGQCNAATTTTTTTSTTTSTLASCGLEDGEVCTSPADCCSLDCTLFNGVSYCGGCLKLGETCSAGTDCCSGTCDPTLSSCVN